MPATAIFMKLLTLILAHSLFLATAATAQVQAEELAGTWTGELETSAGPLGMVFVLEQGVDGWTGTVDTPEQKIYGLPLTSITVSKEREVVLEVASTGGRYSATLNANGQAMTGDWHQRGAVISLVCQRAKDPTPVPEEVRKALAGVWEGALSIGAVKLRISLEIPETGVSGLGQMFSPDQSPDGFPITRLDNLGNNKVRICVGSVFGSFEATVSEDEGSLVTSFHQGAGSYPVTLKRVEARTKLRRPQNPRPPFPYSIEEITYTNEATGILHAGTLTIPEGEGPFPAALLISGSGAQDRDEMIFEHRPFWVLADHLSRRGVAVLRVDDRGVGGSTGDDNPNDDTTADLAIDALRGIEYLLGRAELDRDHLGLIGHSEGGIIAPMAAVRSEQVAFIILLAGTGVRGDHLLLSQNELLMRVRGASEEEIREQLDMERKLFDVILKQELSEEEIDEEIRDLILSSDGLDEGESPEGQVEGVLDSLGHAWIRYFIRHDPAPVLEKVRCPVLAVNGSLDLQVPWEDNLGAIESALARGANPDYTVQAFEGLNHLFQRCETGAIEEYGQIEETFSLEVLEVLSSWILARAAN